VMQDDTEIWRDAREFLWVKEGAALVKIPLTVSKILNLEAKIAEHGRARYISSGNLCWLEWTDSLESLDVILLELQLSGLVLRGNTARVLLGKQVGGVLLERVLNTFAPERKFDAT
jgi:hypothetical protein